MSDLNLAKIHVSPEDALAFLETALRNATHVQFDSDCLADVANALSDFAAKSAEHPMYLIDLQPHD